MDNEQIIRLLKERENKDSIYLKVTVTLILIIQIIMWHIICVNITLAEKKTDYRYFNLVNSLEKIHGVYIDTYDGMAFKTREELNAHKETHSNIRWKRTYLQKYMKLLYDKAS